MSTTQKWTADRVQNLIGLVGTDTNAEVSADSQNVAAEQLGVSIRSIASKLRNLNYPVASTAAKIVAKYTEAQEEELRAFVESNANQFTYSEIAGQIFGGIKTAKEIQGKILSMELFSKVKPTPKVEAAKKYNEAEEAKFVKLMESGAFLEDIADAMDRSLNSVRGKALSLTRSNDSLSMPKQRESHAAAKIDALGDLGEAITGMTVEEIADKIGKTARGIKTMLTRRAISVKDYNGAKKAEKNANK